MSKPPERVIASIALAAEVSRGFTVPQLIRLVGEFSLGDDYYYRLRSYRSHQKAAGKLEEADRLSREFPFDPEVGAAMIVVAMLYDETVEAYVSDPVDGDWRDPTVKRFRIRPGFWINLHDLHQFASPNVRIRLGDVEFSNDKNGVPEALRSLSEVSPTLVPVRLSFDLASLFTAVKRYHLKRLTKQAPVSYKVKFDWNQLVAAGWRYLFQIKIRDGERFTFKGKKGGVAEAMISFSTANGWSPPAFSLASLYASKIIEQAKLAANADLTAWPVVVPPPKNGVDSSDDAVV